MNQHILGRGGNSNEYFLSHTHAHKENSSKYKKEFSKSKRLKRFNIFKLLAIKMLTENYTPFKKVLL